MMKPKQPTRNVPLKDLSRILREELQPRREGDTLIPRTLHALLNMGRIRMQEALLAEVEKKLRTVSFVPLLIGPEFQEYKEARPHHAYLVSGLNRDDAALLDQWGACNGDIVSAWIVTELPAYAIAAHLRGAICAWDMEKTRRLMFFYNPLITPILHRVADPKWVEWFFGPMLSWWYPVASPQEETWSRIEGGGRSASGEPVPLNISEELYDALGKDTFPYQVLNLAEQTCPSAFGRDSCYGVRLARIEELLEAGKQLNLKIKSDLVAYVLALLETPEIAKKQPWQEAIKRAVAGEDRLENYFRHTLRP